MYDFKTRVKIDAISLGDYLKITDEPYKIPFSQRKYEWKKKEINRLFQDFKHVYKRSDSVHPLNFMTLAHSDKSYKIYDGQQRTITCLLMVSVIYQKMNEEGMTKAAKQKQDQYISYEDYSHKKRQNKLDFDSKTVSDFFYKITDIEYEYNYKKLKDEIKEMPKNSNKRTILNNYVLLKEEFNNYMDSLEGNINNNLIDFFDAITNRCFIVELVADSEQIASNMFESLNNTGKDISKFNVLKNDLVRVLGEQNVKDYWTYIDKNIIDLSQETFLMSFATVLGGKTSSSKVLDSIYEIYNPYNETTMNNLLKIMKKASDKFITICKPNQIEDSNSIERDKFIRYSNYLSFLNIKQQYPIILSMLMKNFKLKDINDVLWSIIVVLVRKFTFNTEKANTIENAFAKFANDIYYEKINKYKLIDNINSFFVDDSIIKQKIINKEFKKNKNAIAILTMIYNHDLKKGENKPDPSSNDLEHILPINPKNKNSWMKGFENEDEMNKYTYNIGNLTLWYYGDNRSAQNIDFIEKRKKYSKSHSLENINISKNKTWSKSNIKNRSNVLADRLLKLLII